MSKSALGQNGAIMGSGFYFRGLNSGLLLAPYLPDTGGYDYRGALDEHKVLTLQHSLNRLGLGMSLREDGVYGEKTSAATQQFYDMLKNGQGPVLKVTEAAGHIVTAGDWAKEGLDVAGKLYAGTQGPRTGQILGMPPPRFNPGFKISGNGHRISLPRTSKNYIQISPETFHFLKRFEQAAKVVEIAGKVLVVTNVMLETVEATVEIDAALNVADSKIGAATGRTVGGFVGSMAGMAHNLLLYGVPG